DEAYILKNERVWSIRDLAQAEAHRYQQRFILNLVNQNVNVESGDKEISEIHPILIDTAQTLGEGYDSFFFIDEGDTDDDDGNGNGNGNGDDDELPFDTDINGLMGYYYSGANFDKQEVVRIDSVVDFSWDAGSPMSLIPSDNFSVRWIGKIKIDETRDYNFWTWSDDGVRLYIDDQLVVNNWTNHMTRWDSGRVNLTEGYHDIKLEYYEKTNGSFIKLCWDARNNVIPKTSLFPITGTYIGN
ncbi:MAG: hypothetical protein HQ536_04610, partial [Parcubacteria group bacterium]|nr:hypothetical protein [Parcubacteria group bacterium]